MTTNEIHERLTAQFGEDVGPLSEPKLEPSCVVKRERIRDVCRFLKTTPGLDFDYCEDIGGVDYPKRDVIEVVYHLFSYNHRHGIVLRVEADRANAIVPSVESVWKAANWLEREIYDLLGVGFTGHPDMRRILLPDDWEGHPLRKDWQEKGGYHGVTNTRENPLVELRRLDDKARAALAPPPTPAAAPPPPAAAPAPTAKA